MHEDKVAVKSNATGSGGVVSVFGTVSASSVDRGMLSREEVLFRFSIRRRLDDFQKPLQRTLFGLLRGLQRSTEYVFSPIGQICLNYRA